MRGLLFSLVFLFLIVCSNSQTVRNLEDIKSDKAGNTYVTSLFNDSLASSFCIIVPDEVKPHRHLNHCEHVLVLEGEGMMRMGEKEFLIKKNDLVFIPANSVHAVKTKGSIPLKVLSIQAPYFDGSDRVFEKEK